MGYDDGWRKSCPDPGFFTRIAIGVELFRAGSLGCEQASRSRGLFEDRGAQRVLGANEGRAISQGTPEPFSHQGLEDDAFKDPLRIPKKENLRISRECDRRLSLLCEGGRKTTGSGFQG